MGLISDIKINGNIIKGTLEGVGGLFKDIRSAITGKLDPEKEAELAERMNQTEVGLMTSQSEINKLEAQNTNIFVSGWRPATGWCCVTGLVYTYFLQPIWAWISLNCGIQSPPSIDTNALYPLLLALLGLGTMRSYEKKGGVARN